MFKKVLLTTDGSKFAEKALPYAVDLAKQCGAHVRAVTVVENPVFYGMPEAAALYDAEFYRSLAAELEKAAQAAVDRATEAGKKAGVPVTATIRHGMPADEVLAEAKEWGADVIVTSTHGRSGMARLLLGSVSTRLVNHAPCPVLLVKIDEDK